MAFVKMQSAEEEQHRAFTPYPNRESPGVTVDGRWDEAGDIAERDGCGLTKAHRPIAETRTEDNGSCWAEAANRALELGEGRHHGPAGSVSLAARISSNICL